MDLKKAQNPLHSFGLVFCFFFSFFFFFKRWSCLLIVVSSVGSYSTLQHLQRVLHTGNSVHAFIQETEFKFSLTINLSIYTNNTVLLFWKKLLFFFSHAWWAQENSASILYNVIAVQKGENWERGEFQGVTLGSNREYTPRIKRLREKQTFEPLQAAWSFQANFSSLFIKQ